MRSISVSTPWLLLLIVASAVHAQHADVLLQQQGNKIVTGLANFDGFAWTVGARVFSRDFDSDYEISNPGFDALGNTSPFLPAGYSALPASTNVLWDFLPMTVPPVKANLLYWNGLDGDDVDEVLDIDDVSFSTLPGYTLTIDGIGGIAAADGSDEMIEGPALVRTDSTGSIHSHRDYILNGGVGSDPVDGIYLIALRVKMETLEPSKPFFMVFGSWQSPDPPPSAALAARNLAVSWVTQRVDSLVVDRIPGDYNDDGVVDAADYAVWRDALGSMTNLFADGDGSESIDIGDYGVWRENYGSDSNLQFATTNVSEPSCVMIAIVSLVACAVLWRRFFA